MGEACEIENPLHQFIRLESLDMSPVVTIFTLTYGH